MTDKYTEGIRLYKNGSYKEALSCFLKEIESGDNELFKLDMAYYIGLCYAKLKEYDNALLYIEQVVTSGTDRARADQCRLILAYIYITTQRFRLADFELHKLIENGVKTPQVLCSLGYIAYVQKRTDDSIAFYEEAVALNENNATALNCLGYILCSQGRELPRALRMCKTALDSQPENPAYLDSLGWIYCTLGMSKEAVFYLSRAAEKLPADETIRKHLATAQSLS